MMIRKIRIFVILFILSFSFGVKADVMLDLTCYSNSVNSNNSTKCDVGIYYEMDSVTDVELEYETNLNIEFKNVDGFTLTKNDNKLLIHSNTELSDEIGDSKVMFQAYLSNSNNLSGKEKLTFKNVKINNSSNYNVDSVSKTFDVVGNSELDSVNTLDSITINDKKIANFDKNKLEYNINVEEEIINIKVTRTSTKSTVENVGGFKVANGESVDHTIKVTAENKSVKEYVLHITNTNKKTNIDNLSKDNTLKSLELYYNKEKIDFDFDNSENSFDIKVDSNVDKIKIKAETNDSKATFDKKYGPRDISLKYGNNKVEIKIYSEDYTSKIYVLNINREDERDTDNTLNSLKINGKEVNLSSLDGYEIILAGNILKTEIEAIANSSKAQVFYEDINLADGNNDVTVSVTAENGEEKEYHINVVRDEEQETSIIFEKLEILGYDIKFSKDKYTYSLRIDEKTEELEIKVYPNNASFEVLNNKKLRHGSKVIIKVVDDEGEHEYTINIEKDSLLLNIICYSVFAIGVVSLAVSIIKVLTIKKKRKNTK